LGVPSRKSKPLPIAPPRHAHAPQTPATPQQLSRLEWWLWLSALLVTTLSAIAFALSSFRPFFLHADHFYEIRSDQARWATLSLLLVFNSWLVFRQWSFRRQRQKSWAQPLDAQSGSQPLSESYGLDPVTGLCNRNSLEQHLGKEVARARRQNTPLSLATLHVDEFAELNARYGKSAVDAALKELARRLKKASRGSDVAARLNDDDFLLLLPECGLNEVKQVLNRVAPVEVSSAGQKTSLVYTTGFVDYQPGDLPADLLKRASHLLHLYDIAAQHSSAHAYGPH
jgi:diguanylate cyclase (GGDEF)-like protein